MITLVTSCTSALARFFLHNIFPLVLVLYVQACLQPFCKQISSLTTEALPCVNLGCCNTEMGVLSSWIQYTSILLTFIRFP